MNGTLLRGYRISSKEAAIMRADPVASNYLHCSNFWNNREYILGFVILNMEKGQYYRVENFTSSSYSIEEDELLIKSIAQKYNLSTVAPEMKLSTFFGIEVS